jgi:hypothetical protein
MKDPAAFGGLPIRAAMSGFSLVASPAKEKVIVLRVLSASAVIFFLPAFIGLRD